MNAYDCLFISKQPETFHTERQNYLEGKHQLLDIKDHTKYK